jgi:ferric-dicitrate binding protein FerR (iron transport regulator)
LFGWTLVTAAAAAAIVIAIVRTPPDTSIARRAEAPPASAAMQIATGPAERKSVPLPAGGELRVDASSVVTIGEGGEIHLNKGALYLDSKGTTLPPVITPAGKITDIGTRFEVRVIGDSTRVRVRDGKVRLAQSGGSSEVDAAEELLARADASTARRRIDPFGAEWAWVTRAAPRFDVEGKSLESFLDWIEREGAWTVEFSSAALERRARSTVLHGSIEDMSTTEALEAILLACGLGHRVDLKGGRVTVIADR